MLHIHENNANIWIRAGFAEKDADEAIRELREEGTLTLNFDNPEEVIRRLEKVLHEEFSKQADSASFEEPMMGDDPAAYESFV